MKNRKVALWVTGFVVWAFIFVTVARGVFKIIEWAWS